MEFFEIYLRDLPRKFSGDYFWNHLRDFYAGIPHGLSISLKIHAGISPGNFTRTRPMILAKIRLEIPDTISPEISSVVLLGVMKLFQVIVLGNYPDIRFENSEEILPELFLGVYVIWKKKLFNESTESFMVEVFCTNFPAGEDRASEANLLMVEPILTAGSQEGFWSWNRKENSKSNKKQSVKY